MGIIPKSLYENSPVQAGIVFLEELFANLPKRNFQFRFWDGSSWGEQHDPRFTLVLKHPGALRAMFDSPHELGLGEAYIFDDFDIEGDIQCAAELGEFLVTQHGNLPHRMHMAELLHRLPSTSPTKSMAKPEKPHGVRHSLDRTRQAISYHYDVPSDFYALWLDNRMVYSCGYFETAEDDLTTAQLRKLDYICRKLRLRRGDRLLDIGCGWGALVIHAAAIFGVQALGITLSRRQAEFARERIRSAGVADRCRVEALDYRELESHLRFDKVASIGMFEHVGGKLLRAYFEKAWDLLETGGVFLNHGIAYSATYHRKGPSFMDRYVFPDANLVAVSTTLQEAEACGFEVIDVESLRKHYALTAAQWLRRLEAHSAEARQFVDEVTYRIWRLYLAGAAHAFRMGRLNIYQTLLAKSHHGENTLPLTRCDWYRSQEGRG